MEIRGKITDITRDFSTGKVRFTVEVTEGSAVDLDRLRETDARFTIVKWRNSRSKDANALLWHCLNEIAKNQTGYNDRWTAWDFYLDALRKYGQYTLVSVTKEALPVFMQEWRTCDVVGERNGRADVLCYYGSSTYDTKEFSVLLDGVIDDMRQAGLDTPTQEELQRALDAWERSRNEQSKKNHTADQS